MHLPGEELADGLAGEDRRGVAVGDAEDVGEDVLVRDERRQAVEHLVGARRVARHAEAAQVLRPRVLLQDLRQHAALHLARVPRHVLDVLELLPVFRARRLLRRRRYRLRHGAAHALTVRVSSSGRGSAEPERAELRFGVSDERRSDSERGLFIVMTQGQNRLCTGATTFVLTVLSPAYQREYRFTCKSIY
uniref:Uncharacterized protein n=1 Tax=Oryza brachyantha TaxID=4533 RepID=J3M8L7_ORYBR